MYKNVYDSFMSGGITCSSKTIVHYEPIYGEEKLTKVQNRDKQKMINCYEKGIELIVIPLGRKGLSKSERENIYQEIYSLIEKNRNRSIVSC